MKRYKFWPGLGAAAAVLGIMAMSFPVAARPYVAISPLTAPFAGPADCGECGNCWAGHTAAPAENGDIDALHSWCMESAQCAHPACGSSAMTNDPEGDMKLEVKVQEALGGNISILAGLLRDYPDRVHLNRDRSAVQVEGCKDDVIIATIPIPASQLGVLLVESGSRKVALR